MPFLLLLEIDYQKILSLTVVLKVRSDHKYPVKDRVSQSGWYELGKIPRLRDVNL